MTKLTIFIFASIVFSSCNGQVKTTTHISLKERQDSIIEKYLKQGAWKYSYFSKEWNTNIDKGLKEDSTIAYLWQQKAMPLFKMRKYELGLTYLDKAVKYDKSWLDYRAFMKCIFIKSYKDALTDFLAAKKDKGNSGVMDHSYDFYISLCYLQLNDFDKALNTLKSYIDSTEKKRGTDWVHHLDLFYLGIIYYELSDYDKAIEVFNKSLLKYPEFSDAKYYKGMCIYSKGQNNLGIELMRDAKKDFDKGYTINEDNAIYEPYPYQVNWKMIRL